MGLPLKSSCTERTWDDRSLWSCGWLCQYLLTATKKIWDEKREIPTIKSVVLKPRRSWRYDVFFFNKVVFDIEQKTCLKAKKVWFFFLLKHQGIVHPKWKFCHHLLTHMSFQTCILSYVEHKIRYFEEPNSYWSPLTSIVGKEILWKSIGTINCLITSILQNIFFYVQNMKEYRFAMTWVKNDKIVMFEWTMPLTILLAALCNCKTVFPSFLVFIIQKRTSKSSKTRSYKEYILQAWTYK